MNKAIRNQTFEDRGYYDLHEHIERLRDAGLLFTVDREINKDTEMHPLVRWQYRGGVEEEDRKLVTKALRWVGNRLGRGRAAE